MSTPKNASTLFIQPIYERNVQIDENIHSTLSLHALSLYMAFRYEADYGRKESSVKRSARFMYEKAKISRAQYYRAMNELEANGLILRDPNNVIGDVGFCLISQRLNHFNTISEGVSDRDRGVSDRDTYQESLPSSINTTSDNSSSVKTQEVVDAYHETLPDSPKIKVCGNDLTKQIRAMIKNWHKYQKDGNPFSIESFKDYLLYIKAHYSWFLKAYPTESGKMKRNNLTNITREKNIVRIVNGEFSAN